MLDLEWRPEATRQLEELLDYIAARNFDAAARLERAYHQKVELACKFPAIGRPGRVAGTRELVIHPNYLAIYRVGDEKITILRALHARQRYP